MNDLGAKPMTVPLADSLLCVSCESIFSNADLAQGICPICNSPSILNLGRLAHATIEEIGDGWIRKANYMRDQLKGVATRITDLQENLQALDPEDRTIVSNFQGAYESITRAAQKLSREIAAVMSRGYR